MRVCIICNKGNTCEANAKHSGYHFAWGFEDIGDDVVICHFSEQNQIIPSEYTFFMSVDSSQNYELRDDIHPLVVYNGDTHMPGGVARERVRCANADIVFNGNYEFGAQLVREQVGTKSVWLPLGYDRRFDNYKKDTVKTLDVSMIGHDNSGERTALWEVLRSNCNAVVGNIGPEEYVKANTQAKIVVNQPTEPWDVIYNNRMLEGMACQCLVLQKRLKITSHELLFDPGKEFVYWETFPDLLDKIGYYLREEKKRYKIATAAYEKVIRNYSYRHLCLIIKNHVLNFLASRL